MKKIKAKGLASVSITLAEDGESVALLLSDTSGKSSGYLLGPEGVNALLEPLLGLAGRWADKRDLEIEKLSGSKNALPAHHISFERGRTNTETAVRVFVGKMELTFIMPLDSVIAASAALVQQIDPESGKPAH